MAIAPLMEYEGLPDGSCGLRERPWPRPVLRVVPTIADGPSADAHEEDWASAARRPVPADRRPVPAARGRAMRPLAVSADVDVTARRARRALVVRRRRRLLFGALVAGLVTLLALPLGALGGATPPAPTAAHAATTGAVVYVVQPGDTLWSIASRFDRGQDPRPLAKAIAGETGSAIVVPGERITIP